MIAVIIGGSGSGKSEYAENIAIGLRREKLIYIATMQPFGEEGQNRIRRHHQLRSGKGFETIECYTALVKATIPPNAVVLLECVSNLVANEMFSETGAGINSLEAVKQGLEDLMNHSEHLVIVTNNVFDDGFAYGKETMVYMKVLGQINQWICSRAGQVVEVIHGIPLVQASVKGMPVI